MTSSWLQNALVVGVLGTALACGCGRPEGAQSGSTPKRGDAVDETGPTGSGSAVPKAAVPADPLRARDDLPPERRALLMVNGAERWVDAVAIEAAGYTLVDLRDDWTPSIFAEDKTPEGVPLPNRYRRVLLGLANDQLDNDGEPLEPGEKNYLELYGIFPSLSVLRARFLQDAAQPCHDQESAAVIDAVETVTYVRPRTCAATRSALPARSKSWRGRASAQKSPPCRN